MPSGYIAIEDYLNELAEKLIYGNVPLKGDLNLDGTVDYADLQLGVTYSWVLKRILRLTRGQI
jgi:hypothetical protein